MMEDWFPIILLGCFGGLCCPGVVFLTSGTLDSAVVRSCETRGYWQTGQTRVICSVEKPAAK